MDPLTHTFVGATLGKAGLERRTALAMPTLLIGANLPDVDVLALFGGDDVGLAFRRGWTHGVPALILLPILLTLGMVLYDRRFRDRDARPIDARQLLLLSYISVWSHPALDWLNTYGIRLLMPFDGRWFYGDSLYIIDPWVWLALGGILFLLATRKRRVDVSWAILALLATLFVLGVPAILLGQAGLSTTHWIWLSGITLLIVLRWRHLPREPWRGVVVAVLIAVGAYIGSMVLGTQVARHQVVRELEGRGIDVKRIMVGPVPLDPLAGEIVIETAEGNFRAGSFHWLDDPRWRLEEKVWERAETSPIARAAMTAPYARGFVNWARFPIAEVLEDADGYTVYIRDLRYTHDATAGFGVRKVRLDRELNPRPL